MAEAQVHLPPPELTLAMASDPKHTIMEGKFLVVDSREPMTLLVKLNAQSDDFQTNYKPLTVTALSYNQFLKPVITVPTLTFIVEKTVEANIFAVPFQIHNGGGGGDIHTYEETPDIEIPYPPQVAKARTENLRKAFNRVLLKIIQKMPPVRKKMLLPWLHPENSAGADYLKGTDNQAGDYEIYAHYAVNDKRYWCGARESQPLWIRIKDTGNPSMKAMSRLATPSQHTTIRHH